MDPISLSLLGSFSTSLGALFVLFGDAPNLKMLSLIQGFNSGVLLTLLFVDMVDDYIKTISFLKGNYCFFAGVVFFAIIADIITTLVASSDSKSITENEKENEKKLLKNHRRQVLCSGIVTAIAISFHNLPEAVSYFLESKKRPVGVELVLSILLHHIPEGVAVALPVYFGTQRKWQAFKLATLSGFLKPFAVVFTAYLLPTGLNLEILECLLVSGCGMMTFLTFHEIMPMTFQYVGDKHNGTIFLIGMAFASASMYYTDNNLKFGLQNESRKELGVPSQVYELGYKV